MKNTDFRWSTLVCIENNRAHLVWRRGMGSEMQRKGSKVLLCFRQWGHVSEDLRKRKHIVALVFKKPTDCCWLDTDFQINLQVLLIKSGRNGDRLILLHKWTTQSKWTQCSTQDPLDLIVRTEKMSDVTGENERDKRLVWVGGGVGLSSRKSPLGRLELWTGTSRSCFHLVASLSPLLLMLVWWWWCHYGIPSREEWGSFPKRRPLVLCSKCTGDRWLKKQMSIFFSIESPLFMSALHSMNPT